MSRSKERTDWDTYYARPYKLASLTRRYTASVLEGLVLGAGGEGIRILEIGGANSCFIDRLLARVRPSVYDVIDNNRFGLDLLTKRYAGDSRVSVVNQDVLNLDWSGEPYDLTFSVGLIEHFGAAETAQAIAAHFLPLRSGGTAIITFPTPTALYRVARWLAEATGTWIFHDERPLRLDEVVKTAERFGVIRSARILWPQILTQYCVVTERR